MRVSLIFFLAGLIPTCALAQTPIAFNFVGSNPGQTNPWNSGTVTASGVTQPFVFGASAAGWTRASGLVGENAANRYNTSGWTVTSSLATLIANNDYMGFGMGVASGHVMNLNSATVGIAVQRNGQGPTQYVLMSNLPGYGLAATDPVMYTGTISGGNSDNITFVLPATGLNNLIGNYEFRLIGLNANSTGGTFSAGIQNDPSIPGFRIFNGSVVAIPEPMTVALCGLAISGGVSFWRYRRRQKLLTQAEDAAEQDDLDA